MKFNLLMYALMVVIISCVSQIKFPMDGHPKTTGWDDLFNKDLSNAEYTTNVWTSEKGILTADKDQVIWSKIEYENFVLDLEFNMEPGANSGVFVYCSDKKNHVNNSLEISILDDTAEKWAKSPAVWQCGAIFAHSAPTEKMGKKPGEWNHMTIACKGQMIYVVLNEKPVSTMDMSKWTSAKNNPDGSEIPARFSTPRSELKTKGFIGLQGKHADAKCYFKNLKIRNI